MKRRYLWVILALLLLPGVQSRSGREMEERRLLSVLAVDGAGPVTVTGLPASRETDGTQACVRTQGESLAGACIQLRRADLKENYLGQTSRILLGEGAELSTVLDYALKSGELRLDTLLTVVDGPAGAALEQSAPQRATESGGADPRGQTVGSVLSKLRGGRAAVVPLLTLSAEGSLEPGGWRVFWDEGRDWLDLTNLAGEGCDLLLVGALGQGAELSGGTVALTAVSCHYRGDQLYCQLKGRVEEGTPQGAELKHWGEERLRAALTCGHDCWGLTERWHLRHPFQKRSEGENLAVEICVGVELENGGADLATE